MQTYEYILYMRIDIDVVFSLKRPLTHWGPDRTAPWRFNDHLREWHYQRQTGTFFQIWQPPGVETVETCRRAHGSKVQKGC